MTPTLYVWSDYGEALGVAMRAERDGWTSLLRMNHATHRDIGRGLVPLTQAPPPKGALVFFDATSQGKHGRFLRAQGHPVIGGNPFDRDLEIDRACGTQIMAACGIALPETHGFTTIQKAIAFLEHEEGDWFVKFSGGRESALTQSARTTDMLIRRLLWLERTRRDLIQGLELQRKIEGVEIDCEGFFDGTRWVPPFNVTLEDKQFMPGNRGPRGDCESNVVAFLDGDAPRLAAQGVTRVGDLLAEHGYIGPLGFNQIVAEDGVSYGLEWTARAGWDSTLAYMHCFGPDFVDQLEAFARGDLDHWEPTDPSALSLTLRLSVPPYPNENRVDGALKRIKGMPLDPGLLEGDLTTLVDVRLGPDGAPVLAGTSGHIGTVGAVGRDLKALRKDVLGQAKAIDVDDLQFRIDPSARVERDWKALVELGLLRPLERSALPLPVETGSLRAGRS